VIAFENHVLINRTLIFVFQRRSLLRPFNCKNGAGKTPFYDVGDYGYFNWT
jgi:hypothetical protein